MHTTTNLSTSLPPLMKRAKSEWVVGGDPREIVNDLLKACEADGLEMVAPLALRSAAPYISGSLHRATFEWRIIIVGPSNVGKDRLTIQLLDKDIASALDKVKFPDGSIRSVLEDQDEPDKTPALIRVEFEGGLVLINTPGFYEDPTLDDMTRAVLELETESEVSEIRYIDSARSPAELETLPVEDIPVDLENDIILYMVNLAMTPLGPFAREIRRDLQSLRERVGDRLIVVGSFLDRLQEWSPEKQERRRADWSEILQNEIQMVEYSGLTGQGTQHVVHQLLRAANRDPSYLLPFLRAERKASRLSFSFYSLAALLSSLCDLDQRYPYTDLIRAITLTCAIHLTVHYSVSEEEWFAKNGDISRIVEDGMSKETVSQERDPKGFLERIRRWWSGKRFYEDVQVYHISIEALGEVLGLLYALIHELEGVSSAVVTDAERWFAAELEKVGVASGLSKKDIESVQRALSDVMLKFWRLHHPEALDLKARLNL